MSQCLNCQFYDRKSQRAADARGLQWGLCRREAPLLNPVNQKAHAIEGVWPTVRDDDWCGRWEAQRGTEVAMPSAATLAQSAAKSANARAPAMAGPRTQTLASGPRTLPIGTSQGPNITRTVPLQGSAGNGSIAGGLNPTTKK